MKPVIIDFNRLVIEDTRVNQWYVDFFKSNGDVIASSLMGYECIREKLAEEIGGRVHESATLEEFLIEIDEKILTMFLLSI